MGNDFIHKLAGNTHAGEASAHKGSDPIVLAG
jgi:hypothetical protein